MDINLAAVCVTARPKYAKKASEYAAQGRASALAGFKPPLGLIYYVNAALAAHDAVVAMTTAERFQRITDFHGNFPPFGG
jgi:hypothetical protein